jgi:hypothetical protein
VTGYYGGARIRVRQGLMDALEAWLSPFRIHGALIAVAALLSAAALRLSPDARARRGVMLLVGFAAVLFVVPTATASYEARYGVPGSVLLVIASARGTELVVGRLRQIRAKWLDGGVEPTALWSARQPAAARARRAGRAFARHVARQLPL